MPKIKKFFFIFLISFVNIQGVIIYNNTDETITISQLSANINIDLFINPNKIKPNENDSSHYEILYFDLDIFISPHNVYNAENFYPELDFNTILDNIRPKENLENFGCNIYEAEIWYKLSFKFNGITKTKSIPDNLKAFAFEYIETYEDSEDSVEYKDIKIVEASDL